MWTIQSAYDQARAAAAAKAPWHRDMAAHLLKNYVNHLPGMSRQEIGTLLAKSNQERLAAQPSLARYPELRGMREIIQAQWRGTQDGAGLDDVLAAVMANGHFYYHRYICGGKVKPKAHCTCAYFPISDHGPLFATNLDSSPDEPFGTPGWPAASEHLVIGGVSSGVFFDEESPEIFPAPVHRIVGRYCRSTDEAVEMFTRYNHFWGPGNLLVIDRDHHVAMFEKTACRIGVRRSPDGFGFVTAMTAEHPEMNRFLADRRAVSLVARGLPDPCGDTRYWAVQDQRRMLLNRLFDEARQAPTLETLRSIMQYRGPDGMVCDNGDVLHPGDPPIEFTLCTSIFCLAEGRALWWARDKARNIPSWQNRQTDVEYRDVWLWK
jgi:hypothetical protein